MESRITLTSNNHEIKYEYRHNRVLLMFTSFNDNELKEFTDLLDEGSSQIHQAEKIIPYEDGTGAVVITMNVGYDEK